MLASGADVITLGNWVWGQQGFAPYLNGAERVVRPANLSPATPGRGLVVHGGVAVINLLGQMTLNPFESPFLTADRLVEEAERETSIIVVDFHAEATSEKVAMAYYLAGPRHRGLRHAHPRADERRPRARGRDRRDHRRRHDRPARLGDREQARRPDPALHHRVPDSARGRGRRRADRGRARRVRRRRPGDELRARPRPGRPELRRLVRPPGRGRRRTARPARPRPAPPPRGARAARTRRTGRTTAGRATTSG